MTHTRKSVTEHLTRTLKPFLKEGCEIEVEVDDDGVLQAFKIIELRASGVHSFLVYGDDFTWETNP